MISGVTVLRFISYKRLFKAAANICVCFMLFMPLTAKQLPASEIIITSKIEDILVSKTSTIPKNPEPKPNDFCDEEGIKYNNQNTLTQCL